MSYNLSIGQHVENRFLTAGNRIARDVQNGHLHQVIDKLNTALFQGGPSAPKNFQQLLSISNVSSDVITHRKQMNAQNRETHAWENNGHGYNLFEIQTKISFSAVMGILEGIPVIGSAIAIIMAIGHYIAMKDAQVGLQRASEELLHIGGSDLAQKTREVVSHALKYTMHCNYLNSSLLSIIPLVKPIMRVLQSYEYQQRLNPTEQLVIHRHWVELDQSTLILRERKRLERDALQSKLSQDVISS